MKPNTENVPTGVNTARRIVLLGVGVIVNAACWDLAAERCDDTIAKAIHVLGHDINMRRVLLRADGYRRRRISRLILSR